MIPFFIPKTDANIHSTHEKCLARSMANLPEGAQTIAGEQTLAEFLVNISSEAIGFIFDAEFWYGTACWQRWLKSLEMEGLEDMPNIPLGNQDPAWRNNVRLPGYVTLRGLEHAAENIQANRWQIVTAKYPVCFSVVVLPRKYLHTLNQIILLQDLPKMFIEQNHPVRLFGGGWLHSFSALSETGCRFDLLDMVDWHGYVLELGCDQGLMARACKSRDNNVTWIGLDYNLDALKEAREYVDLAVLANANASLPFSKKVQFDRVVCGDFLEHLPYPWQFLKRLRYRMASGGLLIASFPNIGHWSIIDDLLMGRWDEAPSGILCVTHLRFGTRRSWQRWLDASGWQVVRWESETLELPPKWQNILGQIGNTVDIQSLETLRYRLVAKAVGTI
jgi:2-polyprenyl-3-methyl-5-hydroxy-6-metoxy-1,4-benzoquinol methylase